MLPNFCNVLSGIARAYILFCSNGWLKRAADEHENFIRSTTSQWIGIRVLRVISSADLFFSCGCIVSGMFNLKSFVS